MATRGYSYQITVAPLTDGAGDGPPVTEPLTFTHINHDNIIVVVERVRKSSGLDHDSAAATAIGLKLLSEVMLKERDNALFDPLRSGVREFIQSLKALAKSGDQTEVNGRR